MKRVELHCHTKMSDMDGVSDVKDIVKRAMTWGHKALAITDHGAGAGLPGRESHGGRRTDDFKVIYGVEGYLVDDLKEMVGQLEGSVPGWETYVVFDLETTGFSPDQEQDH